MTIIFRSPIPLAATLQLILKQMLTSILRALLSSSESIRGLAESLQLVGWLPRLLLDIFRVWRERKYSRTLGIVPHHNTHHSSQHSTPDTDDDY